PLSHFPRHRASRTMVHRTNPRRNLGLSFSHMTFPPCVYLINQQLDLRMVWPRQIQIPLRLLRWPLCPKTRVCTCRKKPALSNHLNCRWERIWPSPPEQCPHRSKGGNHTGSSFKGSNGRKSMMVLPPRFRTSISYFLIGLFMLPFTNPQELDSADSS